MILTNREIRVRLDNHISQPTKVKNGIAQGAKSSTTLADIYSNSIGGEETQTKSKVVFIDDTLIIHSVQSNEEGTKEAQQHLNMIYKQSEELNLRLNGGIFQIMRIHENNVVPPETKLKDPEGKEIQYSNQIKVLGYIWSNNFSNDPFLDSQITKARRTFYFFIAPTQIH